VLFRLLALAEASVSDAMPRALELAVIRPGIDRRVLAPDVSAPSLATEHRPLAGVELRWAEFRGADGFTIQKAMTLRLGPAGCPVGQAGLLNPCRGVQRERHVERQVHSLR